MKTIKMFFFWAWDVWMLRDPWQRYLNPNGYGLIHPVTGKFCDREGNSVNPITGDNETH